MTLVVHSLNIGIWRSLEHISVWRLLFSSLFCFRYKRNIADNIDKAAKPKTPTKPIASTSTRYSATASHTCTRYEKKISLPFLSPYHCLSQHKVEFSLAWYITHWSPRASYTFRFSPAIMASIAMFRYFYILQSYWTIPWWMSFILNWWKLTNQFVVTSWRLTKPNSRIGMHTFPKLFVLGNRMRECCSICFAFRSNPGAIIPKSKVLDRW